MHRGQDGRVRCCGEWRRHDAGYDCCIPLHVLPCTSKHVRVVYVRTGEVPLVPHHALQEVVGAGGLTVHGVVAADSGANAQVMQIANEVSGAVMEQRSAVSGRCTLSQFRQVLQHANHQHDCHHHQGDHHPPTGRRPGSPAHDSHGAALRHCLLERGEVCVRQRVVGHDGVEVVAREAVAVLQRIRVPVLQRDGHLDVAATK